MVIAVGLFGFFIFEGKYFIQEQTEARTLVSENILALSQHEDWDGVHDTIMLEDGQKQKTVLLHGHQIQQ